MTEVKNGALEALETACEKYLYGKAAGKEIRTDSHIVADIIAYELRKEGYRIAPIAQPVADETAARCGESQPGSKPDNGIPGAAVLDEKLREAVDWLREYSGDMIDEGINADGNPPVYLSISAEMNHQLASIEAVIAELAELRAERQWNTTVMPEFEKTVMVERESGGFWWGQFVLGEWHLKYGDGCIVADDVIAWRDLPSSSKATPPATGGV